MTRLPIVKLRTAYHAMSAYARCTMLVRMLAMACGLIGQTNPSDKLIAKLKRNGSINRISERLLQWNSLEYVLNCIKDRFSYNSLEYVEAVSHEKLSINLARLPLQSGYCMGNPAAVPHAHSLYYVESIGGNKSPRLFRM